MLRLMTMLVLLPLASASAQVPISELLRSAAEGQTVRVPAGVYREHLRIERPVTLEAVGEVVIDGGGSGDIIEISAPDVTVRGFVVRNTGIDLDKENAAIRVLAPRATIENNTLDDVLFGIDLRESPGSVVRGNRIGGKALDIARRGDGIRLWRADGTVVEGNTLHDGRDAILWYSSDVVARGNTSRRCRYGLHLMYCDNVSVVDNDLAGNSVGVYIMYSKLVRVANNRLVQNRGPSGYGIGLKEADRFTIEHNTIVSNRVGVYLDGSPFTQVNPSTISQNTLAYNDVGMTILPSCRGNVLTANNFVDNIEQINVGGRGELAHNAFSSGERGNYWSDYIGYDADGDGVGDFVHESRTLFENLMDREPKLRLIMFSPAQQAIELVGKAIPATRPEPKFADEYPLMSPVQGAAAPLRRSSSRHGIIATAAILLSCGGALIAIARRSVSTGGAA